MNRKLYFVILIFFTQFFNCQYLFGMDPRQVSISASSKGQLIKLLKAEVAQKPKDLSKQTPDNLRQIIQATSIALENQKEWDSISQELQIKDAHLENLLHKIQNSAQKALNASSKKVEPAPAQKPKATPSTPAKKPAIEPQKTTKTPAPIEVAKKTTRPAHDYIPANNQPSDSQPGQMPKAASSVPSAAQKAKATLPVAAKTPVEEPQKTGTWASVYIPGNKQTTATQPRQMPKAASSVPVEQKAENKKFIIADENELAALAEKYKKGFPVQKVPKLQRLYLTLKSLKHIFGIELQQGKKKNKNEAIYLAGFHHDYNLELEKDSFMVSTKGLGNGIREGFIAQEKTHNPVFKTFFSAMLSREQVIAQWASSLKNIKKVAPEGEKRLLIEGITPEGLKIKTVVKKDTGEVVTFFPVSNKSDAEIEAETAEMRGLFKKFFHSKQGKQPRAPISENEIAELMKLYPDGIPFNMVIAKFDVNTPENYEQFAKISQNRVQLRPFYEDIFIKEDDLEMLITENPGRFFPESLISTLYFTPESFKTAFSATGDGNFPPYLTRKEILAQVVDALTHVANMTRVESDDDAPQGKMLKRRGDKVFIRAHSSATANDDGFMFYVTVDEKTGNIENFYPLFG